MTAASVAPPGSRSGARERLIESYLPLVRSIARRFAGKGERVEDLVQVGSIGLISAVDRCDPARRELLPAYVARTVEGEIRRHLRDRCAVVRIPRRLQPAEAAAPVQLDEDELGAAEPEDDLGLARVLVSSAARSLDSREREIVLLRYFLDLKQDEVGAIVGVSQVHVSRLLRTAIDKMRADLEGELPGRKPSRAPERR
jgi:RNA polymerase sigma-B factor